MTEPKDGQRQRGATDGKAPAADGRHSWLTGGSAPTSSPPMRQLNALLEQPQRVRQLSALELDRLVDDLGTSDALPLL